MESGDTLESSSQDLVLPPHWFLKQSRSKKGRIYYANSVLKCVSWEFPKFTACPANCKLCKTHQLKQKNITMSKASNNTINKNISMEKSNRLSKVIDKKLIASEQASKQSNLKKRKFLSTFKEHEEKSKTKLDDQNKCSNIKKKIIMKPSTIFKNTKLHSKSSIFDEDIGSNSEQPLCKPDVETLTKITSIRNETKSAPKYTIAVGIAKKRCTNKKGYASKWDQKQSIAENESNCQNNNSKKCNSENIERCLSSDKVVVASTLKPGHNVSGLDNASPSNVTQLTASSTNQDGNPTLQNCNKNKRRKKTAQKRKKRNPSSENSSVMPPNKKNRKILKAKHNIDILSKTKPQSYIKKNLNQQKNAETLITLIKKDAQITSHYVPELDSIPTNSSFDLITPMEVDIINTELQNIRKVTHLGALKVDIITSAMLEESDIVTYGDNPTYIVIDTNILISHLKLVKQLSLSRTLYKDAPCRVVIPYTAILELDGLKNRISVEKRARAAIQWCNSVMAVMSNDMTANKVIGQSFKSYKHLQTTMHGKVN